MRVLVIEDYAPLRESVVQALQEDGLAVDAAADGEEGLWHARSGGHDAIVLDIALPKLDGLSILRRIRTEGNRAPVLLLTARDTVADRVVGLDSGADDYLIKPFALEELLARVRALLRRKYGAADPVLRIRDLEINTVSRVVQRGGERIDLTAREYSLLEFLAHRAGATVTRSEIWEHIYDFNSTVESNVVDVYIGYLRRKIERPGRPRLIHTRRGQGTSSGSTLMRSLRLQLLLGIAVGTTAVLLVSGGVLYALISRTLWADFDEALAAKARSLAALVELDEDGLEFELSAASLPEFAATNRAEYYELWSPDGTVFARSPSLGPEDLARAGGRPNAPEFRTVRLPDGRPGRIVGLAFAPRMDTENALAGPPPTVSIVVGRETSDLEMTLARFRRLLIGVGLLAVGLSAALLAWVVHRNLRPVARLSGQIAQVGEGDLSKRLTLADMPRELSPVVDRLNDLLLRLEAAFERERRFTGDVAHELRTPLAGMRARLELALSRDRTPDAYRATLEGCLDINLQMQRMVENLLHLARADSGQLELRREPVDIAALASECWTFLKPRAAARGLDIEWRARASCRAETDPDGLRLILQNILDNAVTYANEGTRIEVSLTNDDRYIVFAAANDSSLPREVACQVFDRFWRADPSHRRVDGIHYGLGLPLCKALVGRLGGSIAAEVNDSGRFILTMRLPRNQLSDTNAVTRSSVH